MVLLLIKKSKGEVGKETVEKTGKLNLTSIDRINKLLLTKRQQKEL